MALSVSVTDRAHHAFIVLAICVSGFHAFYGRAFVEESLVMSEAEPLTCPIASSKCQYCDLLPANRKELSLTQFMTVSSAA